ncbi:pyocin knob domain-containing S74 family peptidase [Lysobacter sp. CA199]|uniref:pyocin knob domain-containing S74 family peptidase n=1 Tax=Lysobacter sp. CA199 TaxID=3455608 RepID=UPI003F8D0C6F
MSGLQINVTAAGRAALVNEPNTGTQPRRISQIGVTSSGVGAATGVLVGELKRLTTFAGAAVADDTVHVTIRDDSDAVYTLRGFALYLDDGTLFAWYAQNDVILEKSAQAMMLLAADVRFVQVEATSLTFGDTNWINPPATTTVQGVVEIATDQESIAGEDVHRAVPPAGLKAAMDARLGADAPSPLIKTILAMAAAVSIRAALELKGAALKDEGSGKGLDADLLDGQHGAHYLAWSNLTGKPAVFPPATHTHQWSDLVGVPATALRWASWDEITGKPQAFPPSAHTHAAADVTAGMFADARIAQTNVTQHQASLAIGWGQITGKPSTYPHAGHTHDGADVTGRLGPMAKTINDWNAAIENGWFMAVGAANAPGAGWWIGTVVQHNSAWVTQTLWDFAGNHRNIWQRQRSQDVWGNWERLRIHESTLDERYLKNTGGTLSGDLTVYRAQAPGTGAIWIGNTGARYLHWDGNNYYLGGLGVIWSSGNFDPNSKANLSGANFWGAVTAPTIGATSSDARLKTDIEDLRDCLATVRRLRPRRYRLIADGSEDFGWIAQEQREVWPQSVHEDDAGNLYVRYGKGEPFLAGAIVELDDKVNDALARLEQRIEALEEGR